VEVSPTDLQKENRRDMSAEQAREKNVEEYNTTANAYDEWSMSNMLMQEYCYYSTINELSKEEIKGKTFMEVGCGPCPQGQKLATLGAKKIYGLDISSEMIENARAHLTNLGVIDKFELICADIFD
jgi:ubiquinone/menaquinone biosynthesis C-methylase UbiE